MTPTLIFTGQHALSAGAIGLSGFAAANLRCRGRKNPDDHVAAVARAMLPLLRPAPDLCVVQGDTSSALGAALAAFTAGVPVAHVEAGLRTFDPQLPWPEEQYRVAIDREAALLFAPTQVAAANLQVERVGGAVHVTGNTAIDAVLDVLSSLPPPRRRDAGASRLLVTCHRRESWDNGLQSIAAALGWLAREPDIRIDVVLHPNAFVAKRMRTLLSGLSNLQLVPPCPHVDLLARMREADLILSDSGGIQEEAPALGVPLLVLREKTERPEGIASGSAKLVGTDIRVIVRESLALLRDPHALARMSVPNFPYGDGRAAPRIAEIIADWLVARAARPAAPIPSPLRA